MDDTFELLTKIYSQLTEFRKETSTRFDRVEGDIQSLKNDVIQIENKLDGLYDGYRQTHEKLEVIEEKVDTLSDKVDKHDIKIQVIEGARR